MKKSFLGVLKTQMMQLSLNTAATKGQKCRTISQKINICFKLCTYVLCNIWFMKYSSNICIYTLKDMVIAVLPGVKGQLISKANCQAVNSSKNEQMNSFLLVCDVFSFLFWKKLRTPKRHFEIIMLVQVNGNKFKIDR